MKRELTSTELLNRLLNVTSSVSTKHRRSILRMLLCIFSLGSSCGLAVPSWAQTETEPEETRTLFVPFDDVHTLLQGQTDRVFMTWDEYQTLKKSAKQVEKIAAPVATAARVGVFSATIVDDELLVSGRLEVEVFEPGLHEISLPLQQLKLRQAMLDGNGAALIEGEGGKIKLLVRGLGSHQFDFLAVSSVDVSTAQQTLRFELPLAASNELRLNVPGNVEIISGGDVITRRYDSALDQTQFELVPRRELQTIAMSLNNKRRREEQLIIARSVVMSELTKAYERIHGTLSFDVKLGSLQEISIVVPDGFQVTQVEAQGLDRWQMKEQGEQRVLQLFLREPTQENLRVQMTAIRTGVQPENWVMPKVQPLGVSASISVLGIVAETRLSPKRLESEGLLPLNSEVLVKALPPSVLASEPGEPTIRPIAAYYATGSDYQLSAKLTLPDEDLTVSTHSLLTIQRQQLELEGGLVLSPNSEKLTQFTFELDQDWRVSEIRNQAGVNLKYSRVLQGDVQRINVLLPAAIEIEQAETILFRATQQSSAWLDSWQTFNLEFPRLEVVGAKLVQGALAIRALDDLTFQVDETTGLEPLDASQREVFGLGSQAEDVAFRVVASDSKLSLTVQPDRSWISCRNYSFFAVEDNLLKARYEVVFEVEGAGVSEVELILPATTPEALAVTGAGSIQVKEARLTKDGDLHRWVVSLNQRTKGRFQLLAEFEQPLPNVENQEVALPLIRAGDVNFQNEMVAVEGDPNRDIEILTEMRTVDIGELSEASYLPGPRLLGAFDAIDDSAGVVLSMSPRPLRPLPPAIIQRAELVSAISTTGRNQTAARYLLKTKLNYLEVELPAGANLWGMLLDGSPVKPQRRGDSILVELRSDRKDQLLNLQIVYEVPVETFSVLGRVSAAAPKLLLKGDGTAERFEVPQADLQWTVFMPTGYEVVDTHGTVFPSDDDTDANPIKRLASATTTLGGGIHSQRVVNVYETAMSIADDTTKIEESNAPFGGMSNEEYEAPMEAGVNAGLFDGTESKSGSESNRAAGRMLLPGSDSETSSEELLRLGELDDSLSSNLNGGLPFDRPQSSRPRSEQGQGLESSGPGARRGGRGFGGGGGIDEDGDQNGADRSIMNAPNQSVAMGDDGRGLSRDPSSKPVDAAESVGKYWALQGLGSLQIEIETKGSSVQFSSVGEQPRLEATLLHRPRLKAISWAIAFATFIGGVLLDRFGWGIKLTYITIVVGAALAIPLAGGVWIELSEAFDLALMAGLALIPWYVLVTTFASARDLWKRTATAAMLLLIVGFGVCGQAATSAAQEQADPFGAGVELRNVNRRTAAEDTREETPISVPENALIVPFDPELGKPLEFEKVLVPYAEYRKLMAAAFPDQEVASQAPVPFVISGADYQANLDTVDSLRLFGKLEIEVYESKERVWIPLRLRDAVITAAKLDGKPASLSALATKPDTTVSNGPQQAQQQQAVPVARAAATQLVGLAIDEPGRYTLELELQVASEQQGGWQLYDWVMPTALASQLELKVPTAGTQLRVEQQDTSKLRLTKEDNESFVLNPDSSGLVKFAWRPQLDEGTVDQSLTVNSAAVLDVLEQGLKLHWRLKYTFGRDERSQLRFELPVDVQVEAVTGKNVRGWDLTKQDDQQVVDVQLLKAVRQQETISVVASRRGSLSLENSAQFELPKVVVSEAALHRGTVLIRRTPVVELRTQTMTQVVRTEIPASFAEQFESTSNAETPLGLIPFQGYSFNTSGFIVELESRPADRRFEVEHRTIWRVGETEANLEAKLTIRPSQVGVHQLGIEIPANLDLKVVEMPGDYVWSIDDEESNQTGRKMLRLFSSQLIAAPFEIRLSGRLDDHNSDATLPFPRLSVQEAEKQMGYLVIQSDPSLDVKEQDLVQTQVIPVEETYGWLDPSQRKMSRRAFRCLGSEYAGQLKLNPKQPQVVCDTITNVRVTYRAIETTLLFDFSISQAGVRSLQFRLPASLGQAKILAKMVRSEERIEEADGRVLVTLQLQDAVMGQYRVVVERDRELSLAEQGVPIPEVVTGESNLQFLTLQNAGRDELVVVDPSGFEKLERDQRQWQTLVKKLQGGDYTMAYRLRDRQQATAFSYASKRRQLVQTSGARIGLAETMMVVDSAGGYRAAQIYHVDNRTEPFLEIELPDSAQLWTAVVAGSPVKPAVVKDGPENLIRIPIVKTSEGDLDYRVVLKYGGRLQGLTGIGRVEFPFIKTLNINVELSQLQLYLPEDRNWFDFDGSAIQVNDEAELLAGYLDYETQQVERLTEALQSKNSFSVTRAAGNLKTLESRLGQLPKSSSFSNDNYRRNFDSNTLAIENARQQILQNATEVVEQADNRDQLNQFFQTQRNGLSSNSVNQMSSNFALGAVPQSGGSGQSLRFDDNWLGDNGLSNELLTLSDEELAGEKDIAGGRFQNRFGKVDEATQIAGQNQAQGFYRDRLRGSESGAGRQTQEAAPDAATLNEQYGRKLAQQSQRGVDFSGAAPEERFLLDGVVGGVKAESPDLGFASLDIELPKRGKLYLFVTPRGVTEMSARNVDAKTVQRSTDAFWLLGLLAIAGVCCFLLRRLSQNAIAMSLLAVILFVVGAGLLFSGYWPLIGLFAWLCTTYFVVRAVQLKRERESVRTEVEVASS